MPIDQTVKDRAYTIDPPCWKSYSGNATRHKQRMDSRRTAALAQAAKELTEDFNFAPGASDAPEGLTTTDTIIGGHRIRTPPFNLMFPKIGASHMTPLHILIGIHYHSRPVPYAWDRPDERSSKAVRAYTEDLVRAGLLTPREPDTDDVPEHVRNTAAFATTDGLRMWVDALTATPLPRLREAWTHPALSPRVAAPRN